MIVNWYDVGNKNEFLAKGIPQEVKTLNLEDLGQLEVVFISGFSFSVIANGEMLTPHLNGRNPFYKTQTSCYVDEEGEVWVGYEVKN